jgi:uncharacterized protein (DUF1800 family)
MRSALFLAVTQPSREMNGKERRTFRVMCRLIGCAILLCLPIRGEDLGVLDFSISGGTKRLSFSPLPAVEKYSVVRAPNLLGPYVEASTGVLSGFEWLEPVQAEAGTSFFRVRATPVDPAELVVSTVLNRIAFGPTPDESARVRGMGPDAYIEEQLAPESIPEELEIDVVATPEGWQYVTATGTGSSSTLYVYLRSPGRGWLDDLTLVAGSVPEVGVNLIRDGGFAGPLDLETWTVSENHELSEVTDEVSHSGNSSLRLQASSGGTTQGSSIWQVLLPGLSVSRTYTLSFWYLPDPANLSELTVRLSGRGIEAATTPLTPMTRLMNGVAGIGDLQEWTVDHAVQSRRQLLEVLTQFVDNHFTTYYDKSRDYLNGKLKERTEGQAATSLEFQELRKWREVLMNPNGTFYDLLKISTESPAMIIYLDTVTNTRKAPNENFARELMELFTMGVDNGYDQRDIEELSRAWTGWRVEKLPVGKENDPYAARVNDRDNDPGVWSLQYDRTVHDIEAKVLFAGKTIDPRFGPPRAGESYELRIPARGPSSGLLDGYDVIAHLADLPYTQEFISVKLCRLLVNESFRHGVYDYTAQEISPEAALIRDCMAVWEKPAADGRRGNLRNVVRTILGSALFRDHAASRQKIKTPFEYTVSVARAIRTGVAGRSASTDVPAKDLLDAMSRMGFELYRREEPDGWSEFGGDWINTSALVERMRFSQRVLTAGKGWSNPVDLVQAHLPADQWSDAGAVAGFFCDLLFPGEGAANLDLDRQAAIQFLNTDENGAMSPLDKFSVASVSYGVRVRGVVAMLMGYPRFQEQ